MNALNENIRRMHRIALLDLFISIGMAIFFFFAIISLIAKFWLAGFSFLLIFLILLTLFLVKNKKIKSKLSSCRLLPYKIELPSEYSAKQLEAIIFGLCKDNDIYIHNDFVTMTKTKAQLHYRILIYKSENFIKADYDSQKSRANRAFNKKYSVSQWVDRDKLAKMMRLNIICTDNMNDELYRHISQNALHNLTRSEGILVFAVCKNALYIPPLAGNVEFLEVSRYKKSIMFITSALSSKPEQ